MTYLHAAGSPRVASLQSERNLRCSRSVLFHFYTDFINSSITNIALLLEAGKVENTTEEVAVIHG